MIWVVSSKLAFSFSFFLFLSRFVPSNIMIKMIAEVPWDRPQKLSEWYVREEESFHLSKWKIGTALLIKSGRKSFPRNIAEFQRLLLFLDVPLALLLLYNIYPGDRNLYTRKSTFLLSTLSSIAFLQTKQVSQPGF